MTGSEVRWLSVAEGEAWRSFLLAARLLFAELERDMQQGAGIPLTYYEILSVLSEAPGRSMRMSALAGALQVSPSRISHAVARLEESGWIKRELCSSDRRSWFAHLTEHGFSTLVAASPCHVNSVREHLFDGLTAEQVQHLGEISRSLFRHLSSTEEVRQETRATGNSSAAFR